MGFTDLKHLKQSEVIPGLKGRFIHAENITLAFWEITQGTELPEHSHPHEQITMVVKGKLLLNIDGVSREVLPGAVAVIPAGATHSARALEYCEVTDVFYPLRQDYPGKKEIKG